MRLFIISVSNILSLIKQLYSRIIYTAKIRFNRTKRFSFYEIRFDRLGITFLVSASDQSLISSHEILFSFYEILFLCDQFKYMPLHCMAQDQFCRPQF